VLGLWRSLWAITGKISGREAKVIFFVGLRDELRVRWPVVMVVLLATIFASARPAVTPAATFPTGYNPDDFPTVGCFWTGPFTRENEKTNVAFPGTEITYWAARFVTPAGSTLRLKGRFPHARYSSLNSYKARGASQSSLPDKDIRPDKGSTNPTLPGANRATRNRSYTVTVRGEGPPRTPERNTLYAEPVANEYQTIVYRVYIPDRGRNPAGGTGLPQPTLILPNGTEVTGDELCNQMNSINYLEAQKLPPAIYESLVKWPGRNPLFNPAVNPLQFSRYFNLDNSYARFKPVAEQRTIWRSNKRYEGTQYDNVDARYMTGAFSFRYGPVLVLKGKLPTTPRTLNGQKRMTSGQLVAWDMCVIQSLVTTRTWDCVFDEQLPLRGGKKRQYTIVISSKAKRPKNARSRCGVRWMSADPDGEGRLERPAPLTEWVGRRDMGFLLTRNVLPARSFKRSSWAVPTPFPADAIRTMGSYYPKGTYTSKKRFERTGCKKK